MASAFLTGLPGAHNDNGALRLNYLSYWLSIPENRFDTILNTIAALSEKNPRSLINITDVITVMEKFPLEKMDQMADKLVYFCWGEFEHVIKPLAKLPDKRIQLILENTYNFCQKRAVPLGFQEQIIQAVIALANGRITATLNATDNLFSALEKVEPRLKEAFASRYASVLQSFRQVPRTNLKTFRTPQLTL